jgi:ferredoxin/flavodoxin
MKNCIYVFSGTGTSLAIAEKLGNTLEDTEVKLIPKILQDSKENEIANEASAIGFVFPNYYGGVPDIVLRFIRNLNLDKTSYIFAIVSAGGGQGYSLKFLAEELQKKGKKLDYGKYVTGISNYIVAWYYKLFCKTGEQRIAVLKEMDTNIMQFAKDIASQKNDVQKSQRFSYKLSLLLTPKKVLHDTRPLDNEFSTDDKCTACGTCENVCQVKNIKIIGSRPNFKHNCQRCMACFQYCPSNALKVNGKPLNKPKYFHPDYPAKEFIRIINNSNT